MAKSNTKTTFNELNLKELVEEAAHDGLSEIARKGVQVECPSCGAAFRATDKPTPCPSCGQVVRLEVGDVRL